MRMNKINYQLALDKIIEENQKQQKVPSLLMHSCCAPCSSYCLTYLAQYFRITIFYYTGNRIQKKSQRTDPSDPIIKCEISDLFCRRNL